MELEEILKKLKNIEPDQTFTKKSRLLIVGAENDWQKFTPVNFFANLLQSGSAIALAAVLLILILGGISVWKIFLPLNTAELDIDALQAEAHAIDIQIQLANLTYSEPEILQNQTTTVSSARTPAAKTSALNKEVQKEAENLGLAPVTSSTIDLNIDKALKELSQ